MKIRNAVAVFSMVFGSHAYAEGLLFGNSSLNNSNGLRLTTSNGVIFVSNSDSGWWNSDYFSHAIGTNYAAGVLNRSPGPGAINYNNFFTFDLSSLSATVLSASLEIYVTNVSPSAPKDYYLFDVTSPLSLVTEGGTNPLVYDDLMSGTLFGSFTYSTTLVGSFSSILLNENAINSINGAVGGQFGIGGTTISPFSPPPPPVVIDPPPIVVIDPPPIIDLPPIAAVPEPETYAMMLAGLGLLGVVARRRKQKSAT